MLLLLQKKKAKKIKKKEHLSVGTFLRNYLHE